jgi:hypothetical protein
VITDENRRGWEEHANEMWVHQIASFVSQSKLSAAQDVKYGYDPMPAKVGSLCSRALRMVEVEEVGPFGDSGNESSKARLLCLAPFLP